MIKNIVFDMGKVLLGYDAMRVCEHFIEDINDREQVCTSVFVSPEWILLDMGVISDEEALVRMNERLPQRLHEAARNCLEHWHTYCMSPYAEMEPVIRDLKAKGYGIYLLSNAAIRLLDYYKEVIPAVDCFDGIIFSAAEKCIKPQKEIYQILFDRFNLEPSECFFIDDAQINIDGSRACGMDGYCFADNDFIALKEVLYGLNQ